MNKNVEFKINTLIEENKSNWAGPLGSGLGLVGVAGGYLLDANEAGDIESDINRNNMDSVIHDKHSGDIDLYNPSEVNTYNAKVDELNRSADLLNFNKDRFNNKLPSAMVGGVGGLAAGTGVGMAIDAFRSRKRK